MSDTLQFERAEYADAAAVTTCAGCQGALADSYFSVGDRILCRGCAERLRSELENQGSRFGRAIRAIGAGAGAALLGTIVYYAVLALTGYEFALIAIAVGYGVGLAVRWGSNGRGGWAYQGLAIALTYLSIVSAYVPMFIQGIAEENAKASAAGPATAGVAQSAQPAVVNASDTSAPAADAGAPATFGGAVVAVFVLIAFACAAPFLAGAQNIIGLVIIGIGLYEAWKLNRRVSIEISGPHPVHAPSSAAA
jgi:hypothetical protein